MAQTVSELEAAGLVERQPDPDDRRRQIVSLTPTGRQALREDRRRRVGWLAEAIADDLTPEERDVLGRAVPLLERLAEHSTQL
jgi:DNA-binding MarR family transcriptional regulator